MMDLSSQKILLTGATSGLGKELALLLAQEGAQLALCGRNPQKLQALSEQLQHLAPHNPPLLLEAFDATGEEQTRAFCQKAIETLGGLDILINNAGANHAKSPVESINLEDWRSMWELNATTPLVFIQEALPTLKAQQKGLIVQVLSSVCLFANENIASYTASKWACQALTEVLRKEVRRDHIKVMSVFPGGIDTPFRPQAAPDYMSAKSCAQAIIAQLKLPPDVCVHELVLRPEIESNF